MKTEKEYFTIPEHWNKEKAIEYAKSKGLDVRAEGIEIKWYPAKFQIEDGQIHDGYKRDMNEWNGWERPVFTKEQGLLVADEYNRTAGDGTRLFFEDEKFIYFGDGDEIIKIEGQMITVNNEQIHVYDLSLGFIWDQYED